MSAIKNHYMRDDGSMPTPDEVVFHDVGDRTTRTDVKYLKLKDIKRLASGAVLHLAYDDFNDGIFEYEYSHYTSTKRGEQIEWRIFGKFKYAWDKEWSELGDYLYEFEGYICRGSGAERCFYYE